MDKNLPSTRDGAYTVVVMETARPFDDLDDDAAELAALMAAVAESEADLRPLIPHEKVRAWLLEISSGNFDAPPPLSE